LVTDSSIVYGQQPSPVEILALFVDPPAPDSPSQVEKIRLYKNLGDGKLAAGQWLKAEGAAAEVPGVW
jgi:hypothetical protein